MKVLTLTYGPFAENTYIVYDPETMDCAIVDPGVFDAEDRRHLQQVIDSNGLHPVHLINTHMHLDHVIGNQWVGEAYGLRPEANRSDAVLGDRLTEQARMFGLPINPKAIPIETYLEDGDTVRIGRGELKVIAVPGHSPGSIALYDAQDGFVLTGDALFAGSIGRTDLPGGDFHTLINAITTRLLTLPPNTIVYPGHGPTSTIATERATNPCLR